MTCEQALKLADGYLDGELDPLTNQAIEGHLRECPRCDEAYQTRRSLIGVIRNAAPYYKAPAGLQERIQSALRDEMAIGLRARSHLMLSRGSPQSSQRPARFLRESPGTRWLWPLQLFLPPSLLSTCSHPHSATAPINFLRRNSSTVMCVRSWQITLPMSLRPISTRSSRGWTRSSLSPRRWSIWRAKAFLW